MNKTPIYQEDILINWSSYETRVAVLQHGIVQETHIERSANKGLVGNIYMGRVARVLPGMQSAFIDIGLDRAAFLHVADIRHLPAHANTLAHRNSNRSARDETENPESLLTDSKFHVSSPTTSENLSQTVSGIVPIVPIEKLLFEGQTLIVQVIKDPIGTKGARLSTQISVAGRLLVYLPQNNHIGISQRISNETERENLRNRLLSVIPEDESGGFILRTMAEEASDEALATDVTYLRKLWQALQKKIRTHSAPNLIYEDLSLTQRVLRDLVSDNTTSIQTDSPDQLIQLRQWAEQYTPSIVQKILLYKGERPLFDLYSIDEEIEKALSKRVDLKSGGYLIIDQTEALTAIDVNTGGFVGGRNFADTIFKTNLEAAQAIARQLRLRNLGGIIILDLIDMDNSDHQQAVLDELHKAMSRDHAKINISGFSALGLVEMTRKRTRDSLARILCEGCPTCKSKGNIKTARTICYEILREIIREARQFNPKEFRVLAAQQVIDLFLEDESHNLAALGDAIGKPISVQAERSYAQEQYDVILI